MLTKMALFGTFARGVQSEVVATSTSRSEDKSSHYLMGGLCLKINEGVTS